MVQDQGIRCPVYRYVGVSFLVILENFSQGEAVRVASRVMDRFQHGWKIGGIDCICSAQIGMCSYPGYAGHAGEMLKCLELAVSSAEGKGSNQYVMYDKKLHERYLRSQAIAGYLDTALDKEEMEVSYRPVYDAGHGKYVSAEFSMRIFVKGAGMVQSAEFVPIAEDAGVIRAVDYYALERVARMIRYLDDSGKEFESIMMAISPVILQQEDFLERVADVVGRYQIPKGKLVFEIDEYAVGAVYVDIAELMDRLSGLGIRMALDNFGFGSRGA